MLDVDLDYAYGGATTADRLAITGSASLAGVVRVGVMDIAHITPGNTEITILTANNAADAGLTLSAPVSAIAGYSLTRPDADTVQLGYSVNFAPAGTNRNQRSLGNYFNGIQTAGGNSNFDPIIQALFGLPTVGDLNTFYDRMTQEAYVQQTSATELAVVNFTDRMFSCAAPGGQGTVTDGETCGWTRIDLRDLRSDTTNSQLGFTTSDVSATGGIETGLGDGWRLGGAMGYDWVRRLQPQRGGPGPRAIAPRAGWS